MTCCTPTAAQRQAGPGARFLTAVEISLQIARTGSVCVALRTAVVPVNTISDLAQAHDGSSTSC